VPEEPSVISESTKQALRELAGCEFGCATVRIEGATHVGDFAFGPSGELLAGDASSPGLPAAREELRVYQNRLARNARRRTRYRLRAEGARRNLPCLEWPEPQP